MRLSLGSAGNLSARQRLHLRQDGRAGDSAYCLGFMTVPFSWIEPSAPPLMEPPPVCVVDFALPPLSPDPAAAPAPLAPAVPPVAPPLAVPPAAPPPPAPPAPPPVPAALAAIVPVMMRAAAMATVADALVMTFPVDRTHSPTRIQGETRRHGSCGFWATPSLDDSSFANTGPGSDVQRFVQRSTQCKGTSKAQRLQPGSGSCWPIDLITVGSPAIVAPILL